MANTPEQSQLGKASAYTDQYDPTLLFPIPRAGKRAEIGIADVPPFFGADLWTHCKPIKLMVYARYTRRGGLDINPLRTSPPHALPANVRTARQ